MTCTVALSWPAAAWAEDACSSWKSLSLVIRDTRTWILVIGNQPVLGLSYAALLLSLMHTHTHPRQVTFVKTVEKVCSGGSVKSARAGSKRCQSNWQRKAARVAIPRSGNGL